LKGSPAGVTCPVVGLGSGRRRESVIYPSPTEAYYTIVKEPAPTPALGAPIIPPLVYWTRPAKIKHHKITGGRTINLW